MKLVNQYLHLYLISEEAIAFGIDFGSKILHSYSLSPPVERKPMCKGTQYALLDRMRLDLRLRILFDQGVNIAVILDIVELDQVHSCGDQVFGFR